jgi:hypothetical protein
MALLKMPPQQISNTCRKTSWICDAFTARAPLKTVADLVLKNLHFRTDCVTIFSPILAIQIVTRHGIWRFDRPYQTRRRSKLSIDVDCLFPLNPQGLFTQEMIFVLYGTFRCHTTPIRIDSIVSRKVAYYVVRCC